MLFIVIDVLSKIDIQLILVQWRQTLIFIGGALSTFVENQPFVCDYWWCKIYFYTLNSRIIGGAAAPGALQVWRHCLLR